MKKSSLNPFDPNLRQLVVGFELPPPAVTRAYPAGRLTQVLTAFSYAHGFKPLGLLFWGATEDTFVVERRVGNQSQHLNSSKIPARWFESGRSFAELEALAEAGELGAVMAQDLRRVLPMDTIYSGVMLSVHVEGPFESLCVWGVLPSEREGLLGVEVDEAVGAEKAVARVYRQRVLDREILFEATAPAEEDAVRLAQSFIESSQRALSAGYG